MKKALHEGEGLYVSMRAGKLLALGKEGADFLLETANKTLGYEYLQRKGTVVLKKDDGSLGGYIPLEVQFGMAVRDWLARILDEGVSENMMDEINQELGDIRFIHMLMLTKNGTPYWQHISDLDASLAAPHIIAAYNIANQIVIGGFEKLKRCQLRACNRFFLGPRNAKWCSEACGSLYRVRQKRKRDR